MIRMLLLLTGFHDVLEEYTRFQQKKANETDQLKKELASIVEKVSVIEREQDMRQSLKQELTKINSQLEKVEKKDHEREKKVKSIHEKYQRETEQLSTEYKMKLHQLEENMQKEFTAVFTEFNDT